MKKRIEIGELRMGMFVEKVEGSWLANPFWRRQVMVDSPTVLAELKSSQVSHVVIDTGRGIDVTPVIRPAVAVPAVAVKRSAFGRAPQPARSVANVGGGTTPPRIERRAARATLGKGEARLSRVFGESRMGKAVRAGAVMPLVDDIHASLQRNPHAFIGIARFRKDDGQLYRHAMAVCALMIALARRMGLHPEEVRVAGTAGLLMDLGMAHLPIDTAAMNGPLTESERDIVATHPTVGAELVSAGGGFDEAVAAVCAQHHERTNGTGYPERLKGAEITPMARMAAVCDVYDAMTDHRPTRPGMDPGAALAEMQALPGLDPAMVAGLTDCLGIYPDGSLVELRSGRLAIVVAQHPDDPTTPTVRAFYATQTQRFVTPELLDMGAVFGRDAIVGRPDIGAHDLGDVEELLEKYG